MTNLTTLSPNAQIALTYWASLAAQYGNTRVSDFCPYRMGLPEGTSVQALETELVHAGYLETRWSGEKFSAYEQRDSYIL